MRVHYHENIKFCPKCGLERLTRDFYKQKNAKGEREVRNGTEWVCALCGFAFRVMKSTRWQHAEELFKRDRQQRKGKFEDNVTDEVRQAFKDNGDKF